MNKLRKSIQSQSYFTKNNKLLVAVSGGLDSMVLCNLLKESDFNFEIAHVNYHLRGQESNAEEALVRSFAQNNNIPIYVHDENLSYLYQENIQAVARNVRYRFFNDLLQKFQFDFILTAHHADDQIETLFLHLMNGSGLTGLKSMLPCDNYLIRPLLEFSKQDLMNYALHHKIKFLEDSSNLAVKYNRNFIRREILPLVEQRFPSYRYGIQKSIFLLQELFKDFQVNFKEWKLQCVQEEAERIEIDLMYSNSNYLLGQYLAELGFHFNTIKIILHETKQAGKIFESESGWRLNKDREKLILFKSQKQETNVSFQFSPDQQEVIFFGQQLLVEKMNTVPSHEELKANYNCIFLDANTIGKSLWIRYWKDGDKIRPLGMDGKIKKIQDILTDLKIPLLDKEKQLVIHDEHEIIWLVGKVINDKYKITKNTSSVIKFALQKLD